MFKPKLLKQEQGFTLVEVLVAILITVLFVGVAMQAMVIAALFRVNAQEYSEATTWIQEDLEEVKYKAANFQFPQTTLTVNAAQGASSINVASNTTSTANGGTLFAANRTLKVGLDSTNYKISAVSGNTLTITPTLGTPQSENAAVVATTMCTAAQTAGLADALRNIITDPTGNTDLNTTTNTVDFTITSSRTNKSFRMRRTTTLSNAILLQVSYEVSPTSNPLKIIAKLDTEVIPNAAFQCP